MLGHSAGDLLAPLQSPAVINFQSVSLELGNQDPERFSGRSRGLFSVLSSGAEVLEKDHNLSVLTCPNETFLTLSFLPLNWNPKVKNRQWG